MGANSHLCIEYQDGYTDWYCWGLALAESRNYMLYALMAGVRGEYPETLPARGVPKDCSERVKQFVADYGSDGHSHTWLTAKEFDTLITHYERINKAEWKEQASPLSGEWCIIQHVLKMLGMMYGDTRVRLVIFFDN